MSDFSNLNTQSTAQPDGAYETKEFFDKYFIESISYPSNQVDAVVGFFEQRGFDKSAAISVSSVLLQQAKVDNVNVFQLLDTLKGVDGKQLSAVVTQVLNLNRSRVSTLGFRNTEKVIPEEARNILP
jgi:hypothetical protein